MFRVISFFALTVFSSVAASAHARPVTVGADSACDFHSLDRAIAAATASGKSLELRLARNLEHVLAAPLPLGAKLQLHGGYSQCSDAHPLGRTTVHVATPAQGVALTSASVLQAVRVIAAGTESTAVAASTP